jgi:hypothetical protein
MGNGGKHMVPGSSLAKYKRQKAFEEIMKNLCNVKAGEFLPPRQK